MNGNLPPFSNRRYNKLPTARHGAMGSCEIALHAMCDIFTSHLLRLTSYVSRLSLLEQFEKGLVFAQIAFVAQIAI